MGIIFYVMFLMLGVSLAASYEITPVICGSVSLSVHLRVFSKLDHCFFSDIVHDDSWPWYLVSDIARFLKNNFGGLNLGQMGQNKAQN